jgi:predicted DNA-binding transcriptional regulator AlpA
VRPSGWPQKWRSDSPRERDRRVARSYRHALREHAPAVCAELDAIFVKEYGQTWLTPRPAWNTDAAITVQEAAEFAGVTVFAVYKWISDKKLPTAPKEADGLTRVVVADLIEVDAAARKRRKGLRG